jgi:glycerol-3-phosphate dehydrogenase
VRPLRFVLPVLPWARRPAWQLAAGLTAYDALALGGGLPRHRRVSGGAVRQRLPFLAGETRGGFAFWDARAVAPERLALELALEASGGGAAVLNHARVERILTERDAVARVEVESGGRRFRVAARAVINAAGPWVDAVSALAGDSLSPLLGLTRGTHLVLDPGQSLPPDAVLTTAKSDGRVFFAVPQGALLLVGTTDVRFGGDAGSVRPACEDVAYLLEEAQTLLPGLNLTRESILYAYAGLRPLERAPGPEAAITRRHQVVDHGRRGGPAGLFSLVGGKLSTFRPVARELAALLGAPPRPREANGSTRAAGGPRAGPGLGGVPPLTRQHLGRYGRAAAEILALGSDILCEHSGAVTGEVAWAATREKASTLSDILMRRTGISWSACRGLCCHREAARLAAAHLGWHQPERDRQVASFEADLAYHLPRVDELPARTGPDCTSATTSNP